MRAAPGGVRCLVSLGHPSSPRRLPSAVATGTKKWIKTHFDELQFFTLESYYVDSSEVDEKYVGKDGKSVSFAANVAFVRYEDATPYFYFIKVGRGEGGCALRCVLFEPSRGSLLPPRMRTSRRSSKPAHCGGSLGCPVALRRCCGSI